MLAESCCTAAATQQSRFILQLSWSRERSCSSCLATVNVRGLRTVLRYHYCHKCCETTWLHASVRSADTCTSPKVNPTESFTVLSRGQKTKSPYWRRIQSSVLRESNNKTSILAKESMYAFVKETTTSPCVVPFISKVLSQKTVAMWVQIDSAGAEEEAPAPAPRLLAQTLY